jgi:hypothetical protein
MLDLQVPRPAIGGIGGARSGQFMLRPPLGAATLSLPTGSLG